MAFVRFHDKSLRKEGEGGNLSILREGEVMCKVPGGARKPSFLSETCFFDEANTFWRLVRGNKGQRGMPLAKRGMNALGKGVGRVQCFRGCLATAPLKP